MRGVGLTLVTSLAFACALPPGDPAAELDVAPVRDPALAPTALAPTPAAPAPTVELDRVLAKARGRVRAGAVPEATRRELVGSADPDHRHAARLLQAIAGEPVAEVLARSGSTTVDVAAPDALFEPDAAPPVAEPEPTPTPPTPTPTTEDPEPAPAPTEPTPAPVAVARDEGPSDPPPKLDTLIPGSPAWAWFAASVAPTPAQTQATAPSEPVDPRIELEAIVGELPWLLREPPSDPAPTAGSGDDAGHSGDQARLVILTRLSLTSTDPTHATLELAGAGPVEVAVQTLTGQRVRLWMIDTGAVPGFLAARPAVDPDAGGVAVVDVVRRGRRLEVVVELGPGWWLRDLRRVDNGANVEFERVP